MGFATSLEDRWILDCFPRDFIGYAVEVGAYDGQEGSITLALEHAGWNVLAIEPNPDLEPAIQSCRERYWMGACSDYVGRATFHIYVPGPGGFSSLRPTTNHPTWYPSQNEWKTAEVDVETLDRLLARFDFPRLDVLSVDTEGTELDVLKGINLDYWRPKCLIVESWDEQNPIIPYVAKFGYGLAERRLVNDLFLRYDNA